MRHLNGESPSITTTTTNNNNNNLDEELNENEDEHGDEAAGGVRKYITIKVLITKMGRLATFEALRETKETIKVCIS